MITTNNYYDDDLELMLRELERMGATFTESTASHPSGAKAYPSTKPGTKPAKKPTPQAACTLPAPTPPKLKPKHGHYASREQVHVIVDLSNITAGARNMSRPDEDRSITLNVAELLQVVIHGRVLDESLCVGSYPKEDDPQWAEWRANGVRTDFVLPVKDKEDRVDETLHAGMMDMILGNKDSARNRTIILLSGDGNDNHGRKTTFPRCLQYALDFGYKVEVWSWKACTASVYKAWQANGLDNYSLFFLDAHRSNVTSCLSSCTSRASRASAAATFLPVSAPVPDPDESSLIEQMFSAFGLAGMGGRSPFFTRQAS